MKTVDRISKRILPHLGFEAQVVHLENFVGVEFSGNDYRGWCKARFNEVYSDEDFDLLNDGHWHVIFNIQRDSVLVMLPKEKGE